MLRKTGTILALVCLAASTWTFAASTPESQTDTTSPPKSQTGTSTPFAAPLADSPNTSTSSAPSIFEERPVDWRTLIPDIYHDQKTIWKFPFELARGEHWKPALAVGLTLGGLIALDEYDTPYFRKTTAFSQFNRALPSTPVELALVAVPVAYYGLGLVRKDTYETHTGFLAGEAMVDSEILDVVLKNATGRLRPVTVRPQGNYADTWFEQYHPPLRANVSFPSGHAIEAFSLATVFIHRYPTHRWLPWLAYGAATVICFSRITEQQHFPSDVFAGAAFGYIISRYIVMPGREPEP